ncbi:MAG: hypothetical protein WCP92_00885 [bacterium]
MIFPLLSIHNTFHEKLVWGVRIEGSINIPHEDISINGALSVPDSVILIFAMVCHALLISEGIVTFANVMTDANPSTIVKNKRIKFFTERLLLLMLCA